VGVIKVVSEAKSHPEEIRWGMVLKGLDTEGLVGILRYGNGCSAYPDCFTCPFPDCIADTGRDKKNKYNLAHEPIYRGEVCH
jgi:hypothetical protein